MPEEERVRLPPILGIRPGVYLAGVYGFIILVLLFFLCLYPGLSRPGSLVSFRSEPAGAAIRVDGVNRGATPEELFLERGPHRIEFVLPGFETRRLEPEIPGRAAFSLFFPRRLVLRETLVSPGPLAVIAAAAADYASWSFTGESTASYQMPLSLSEGVYRAGPSLEGEEYREAEEYIQAAARFAASQASLRDLGRAKLLLDNHGIVPSPLTLAQSAADTLSWLSAAPGASSWLAGLLPPEARFSPWAPSGGPESRDGLPGGPESRDSPSGGPEGAPPAGLIELAGLRFRALGTGDSGYYAETPVSAGSWEAFVRARPEWAKENLAGLREQGLVSADYLLSPPAGGEAPLTGISWHAAAAFCRWLGEALPPGFEGWEIRLPGEAEWEASLSSASGAEGLWEWCLDPYVPFPSFPASGRAAEAVSSPERVLRKASAPRGSLPPALCSPFAGFRPFLAPRQARPWQD
jgi:hypothetical protein